MRDAAGLADLRTLFTRNPCKGSRTIRGRIETLLAALGVTGAAPGNAARLTALDGALRAGGPNEAWLALAVITGTLPDSAQVRGLLRAARLDGPLPALWAAMRESRPGVAAPGTAVEVVYGRVVMDLHDTARNPVPTGIRRVARQVGRAWSRDHDVILLGWTEDFTAYRRLSAVESNAVLGDPLQPGHDALARGHQIVVPWKCTHLVPELPAEPGRARRYQAFASFSGSTTGLIGYDCIPLTAAETTVEGMSGAFAEFLPAAAQVDRIATISQAPQVEFEGWRAMLTGAGQSGPDIRCIPLPVEAAVPSDAALAEVRHRLALDSTPLVLSVGSHEPRKNHLALLHAAEVLWREGLLFSLVFVGGNSWRSAAFEARVEALRKGGRPVQTIPRLSDDQLWAAYRLAYCSVFASLHEGFGLPVAESLASGTPVITSNFGSMRELATQGGALLVDPRRDRSLTDTLRRLLVDHPLRDRLAVEAARLPRRSWDDYATTLWAYLVDGAAPDPARSPA